MNRLPVRDRLLRLFRSPLLMLAVISSTALLPASGAHAAENAAEQASCGPDRGKLRYLGHMELARAEKDCMAQFKAASAQLEGPDSTREVAWQNVQRLWDAIEGLAETHYFRSEFDKEFQMRALWIQILRDAVKSFESPGLEFEAIGHYLKAAQAADRAGRAEDAEKLYTLLHGRSELLRRGIEKGEVGKGHPLLPVAEVAANANIAWGMLKAEKSARATLEGRDAEAKALSVAAEDAYVHALAIHNTVYDKKLQMGPEPDSEEGVALARALLHLIIAEERIAQGDRPTAGAKLRAARELISETVRLPNGETAVVARHRGGAPAYTSNRRCAKDQWELAVEAAEKEVKKPQAEGDRSSRGASRTPLWLEPEISAEEWEAAKNEGPPKCTEYKVVHEPYESKGYGYRALHMRITLNEVEVARAADGRVPPDELKRATTVLNRVTFGSGGPRTGQPRWNEMLARVGAFRAERGDAEWGDVVEAWEAVPEKLGRDVVRAEEAKRRAAM